MSDTQLAEMLVAIRAIVREEVDAVLNSSPAELEDDEIEDEDASTFVQQ